MCGRNRDIAYLDSHPCVSNPHKEEHYNLRGPPEGVRILSHEKAQGQKNF